MERIVRDVPDSQVNFIVAVMKNDGATVTKTDQGGGLWTITGVFPDPAHRTAPQPSTTTTAEPAPTAPTSGSESVSNAAAPSAAPAPTPLTPTSSGTTTAPAPTASTSSSEPEPTTAASSAPASSTPLRPASPGASTAPAPAAPTSDSEPRPSGSAPSASPGPTPLTPASSSDRLSETSEADNRRASGTSLGTETLGSSGKVPEQAVAIVMEFESFVDHVYDDGVGVATIGYGTTRYPDGRTVHFGDPDITKKTAELYLSHDLEATLHQLSVSIPHWNEMNSNQCSALISFAYNLGDHFYDGDKFTTITATLRDKRWDDVPNVMELYSNPNDPKVHQGLLRRRKDEGELWQGKGRFAKTNLV